MPTAAIAEPVTLVVVGVVDKSPPAASAIVPGPPGSVHQIPPSPELRDASVTGPMTTDPLMLALIDVPLQVTRSVWPDVQAAASLPSWVYAPLTTLYSRVCVVLVCAK